GHHRVHQAVRHHDVHSLPGAIDASAAPELAAMVRLDIPLHPTSPFRVHQEQDDLLHGEQRVRDASVQDRQRPDPQGVRRGVRVRAWGTPVRG
ncbi:unnamed protein product, partial [Ectocarpus fasciculatus]